MSAFAPVQRLLLQAGRIGADPSDSDEVQLQKTLLVVASAMFVLAGLLWGSVYFAFDEPLAGSVPISCSAFTLLNILVLTRTRFDPCDQVRMQNRRARK